MNVVITGASQGIGRAVAEAFAASGADLFLSSRTISKKNWLKPLAEKTGTRIFSADADLSVKEEIFNLAASVQNEFSDIDVLVNNAGIFIPGSIHNETSDALEKTLQINLLSAYHLTRQILPGMMKRRQGHIFNICSTASLKAYPNGGAYSISKWALLGFNRNLREEMKPFGIKVTAVLPGPTLTASWEEADLPEELFMKSSDIAKMILAASNLSTEACVEEIILRPIAGDIKSDE